MWYVPQQRCADKQWLQPEAKRDEQLSVATEALSSFLFYSEAMSFSNAQGLYRPAWTALTVCMSSEYGIYAGWRGANHLSWGCQSRRAPGHWSHTERLDGTAPGSVLHTDDAHLVARPGRGAAPLELRQGHAAHTPLSPISASCWLHCCL